MFAVIDLTLPRLKRTLLLGTRWGQPGAALVPAPGDPWYLNYTYDPLRAPLAPPAPPFGAATSRAVPAGGPATPPFPTTAEQFPPLDHGTAETLLTRLVRIQLAIFTIISLVSASLMAVSYLQAPMLLGIGRIAVTLQLSGHRRLYRLANVKLSRR